jgi:hypothetical protein
MRTGTGNGCRARVRTGPIISIIAIRPIKLRTASPCEFCSWCALIRFQTSHEHLWTQQQAHQGMDAPRRPDHQGQDSSCGPSRSPKSESGATARYFRRAQELLECRTDACPELGACARYKMRSFECSPLGPVLAAGIARRDHGESASKRQTRFSEPVAAFCLRQRSLEFGAFGDAPLLTDNVGQNRVYRDQVPVDLHSIRRVETHSLREVPAASIACLTHHAASSPNR